jgi:hypothetical protein
MDMRRKSTSMNLLILLLSTLFVLFSQNNAFADPVSMHQAQKVAKKWLDIHNGRPLKTAISPDVLKTDTYTDDDGNNLYYVVNFKPFGFVILSADDLVEPIIAFAEKGVYTASTSHPLGALVSGDMRKRMVHVKNNKMKKDISGKYSDKLLRKAKNKWDAHLLDAADEGSGQVSKMLLPSIADVRVSPLLESTWDQGSVGSNLCYNYWTPGTPDTPNGYPCGCVATAMAQLMRYHSYPTTGIGQESFCIGVDYVSQVVQTHGGDNAGGAYNWSLMPLSPDADTPDLERQQIGYLTADAGYAVNMFYTSSGSGASMSQVGFALKETFQYDNAIYGYNSHSDIPAASYINMINANLDAALPILFEIAGTGSKHAIVGDGYGYDASTTMYHHLNLGWGTTNLAANVWYNLPDIDTPVYTYNTILSVIYNIYPIGQYEIISGRVTDASGNPLSGVAVTANVSGGGTFSYMTGTNAKLDPGIYALTNIPSNAAVTLTAVKSGYSFTPQAVTTGKSTDYNSTAGNIGNADFQGQAESCDTTPDQFNLTDQTGVGLSQTITSNAITVSGITCATSISISGGTYSINGGSYTSAAGTVNNGDTVTVRLTSSGSYLTTTNATLTIGGVSDMFSVTTQAAPCDTTPDQFTFTYQTGVGLSQTITSNAITVSGITCATSISISGGTYSINGGSYTASGGTVSNGNIVRVRLTSSGSYFTTTNATLTIGGVSNTFSVTTQAAPCDTTPDQFTFTDQTGIGLSQTGTITWSSATTGTASYTQNTSVTLTATPASGSAFLNWTGCDSAYSNTCILTMTASKSITATFIDVYGNINGDSSTTILDAILALQILAGLMPVTPNLTGDVNGDGKIGLPEVIYILQKAAERR